MEPVTVTAITAVVTYLSGKAFDKAFDTAAGEFTKDSIKWLKSIFFKEDGKPKEVLEELQKDPNDKINHESAVLAVKKRLRNEPHAQQWLMEIADVIESKKTDGSMVTVKHSKNVNSGSIRAGGSVTLGDNNHLS